MTDKNGDSGDKVAQELAAVKRLMILQLLRNGASQAQIASALGVNQSAISRMFSGDLSKIRKPE